MHHSSQVVTEMQDPQTQTYGADMNVHYATMAWDTEVPPQYRSAVTPGIPLLPLLLL